jgi:hypothetical protein
MLSHLQSRVALILNILGELVVSITSLSISFNSFKLKILLKITAASASMSDIAAIILANPPIFHPSILPSLQSSKEIHQ